MTSTARKELKAKGFRVIQGEVGQEDLMENTSQQSAYTDQELVQRACRGESIAFSQLVSKYYERSVRVAMVCFEAERTPRTSFKKHSVARTESSRVSKARLHFTPGFIASS